MLRHPQEHNTKEKAGNVHHAVSGGVVIVDVTTITTGAVVIAFAILSALAMANLKP